MKLNAKLALGLLFAFLLPLMAACGGTGSGAATAVPAAATKVADAATAVATAAAAAATAVATAVPDIKPTEAPKATEPAKPTAAPSTGNGSAEAGHLRMNIGAEPDNTDPQKASFVGEIQWIMLNYQALMTFDTNMKPIPGAAEKVDISTDGKTYTFHMRKGMKYSNGDPLTAKNFEYAWKRLGDPETAGEYQFIACDIIKGYSEYAATTCQGKTITETKAMDMDKLRNDLGVKAIDDDTLEIQLVNPAPYFLSIAALWVGVPTREADAENADALSQGVPESFIGNGPFMLVEHERDSRVVWEPNPNYVGPLGPVKLKKITMSMINDSQVSFQAYKNGELDIVGVAPEDLATAMADPVLSKEMNDALGSCTFYFGFNNAKPPFDNKKVRQAFAQAFDRDAYARDVWQNLGKPTQTFIPPGFPGYEKSDQWAFNPEAAKKTLAEAGYPNGKGLPEIKLTYGSSPRGKVRFEWIANQIKQNLGVDVVLDPVDPTAYTAMTKDPATVPQMFHLGWCADFPDPQNWLTAVFKTGGSASGRISFSNKEFDDLVTKADAEQDATKRAELYSKAQKLLIEEAPVAFVFNDGGKYLLKPYVKGVTQTPLDYIIGFFNLKELDIQP